MRAGSSPENRGFGVAFQKFLPAVLPVSSDDFVERAGEVRVVALGALRAGHSLVVVRAVAEGWRGVIAAPAGIAGGRFLEEGRLVAEDAGGFGEGAVFEGGVAAAAGRFGVGRVELA